MSMFHVASVAVLICAAIGFAVADVFWPLSVAAAIGFALGWWYGRLPQVYPLLHWWMLPAYAGIGFTWIFFKWTRFVERAWKENRRAGPPQWSQHSYDFAAYFFYWPLDLIAYVLSDLLLDAWGYISAMVSSSFNRYSAWRFKKATEARHERD